MYSHLYSFIVILNLTWPPAVFKSKNTRMKLKIFTKVKKIDYNRHASWFNFVLAILAFRLQTNKNVGQRH